MLCTGEKVDIIILAACLLCCYYRKFWDWTGMFKLPKSNSMIPSFGTQDQTRQPFLSKVKVATVVIALIYLCHSAMKSVFSTRWVDFPVFFTSAKKAQSFQTLYDVTGHFQFKYSPFIGTLFGWLFRDLDFETASIRWIVLCFSFWIFFILQSVKRLPNRHKSITNLSLLLVCLFINPLRLEWELGQINGFVLIVLYGTFIFSNRKTVLGDVIAALGFALAIQLKLYSLIAVPVFLFRKRGLLLILTMVWIVATTLGVLTLQRGWDAAWTENLAWLATLTQSTGQLITDYSNISILGWVARLTHPLVGAVVTFSVILSYVVLEWRLRERPLFQTYPRFLAAIVVLNPLVWTYWVLFLIPLVISGSEQLIRRIQTSRGALAGLIGVMISFQMQHSRMNAAYAMFPAVIFLLWLTRPTKFLVVPTEADLPAPSNRVTTDVQAV
ncbi:MAG: DUF2029 domain-containing protein [Proteobacteria bacterium]|nr:MAG: DUF2029 domain-containing protein [Pseudomonadota bacterium]